MENNYKLKLYDREIETVFPKDLTDIFRDFELFLIEKSNGKYRASPFIYNGDEDTSNKLEMAIYKKEDSKTKKTYFSVSLNNRQRVEK